MCGESKINHPFLLLLLLLLPATKLRQVYVFYTCLSAILLTGGVLVSVKGDLSPGASMSRVGLCPGVSVQEGLCLGGLCWGSCYLVGGVSVQEGLCYVTETPATQ